MVEGYWDTQSVVVSEIHSLANEETIVQNTVMG
jgi:hypothetical protein